MSSLTPNLTPNSSRRPQEMMDMMVKGYLQYYLAPLIEDLLNYGKIESRGKQDYTIALLAWV
jgi:hypothetical protein